MDDFFLLAFCVVFLIFGVWHWLMGLGYNSDTICDATLRVEYPSLDTMRDEMR